MKNGKFYTPILITLSLALMLIIVFYMNDDQKLKEGLTAVDGTNIYLETPIETNGYIDQMKQDSQVIETDATTILNTAGVDTVLSGTEITNLQNAVANQQNIQGSLDTLKVDYKTAVDGLSDEVNALVSLRTNAIQEKERELETLENDRQNKRKIVKNNKYFEKRYMAMSNLFIRLAIIIILFTLLIWINNRGYLGETAPSIIFPVFIAFSIFYIIYLYVDIQSRNASDYDKIDFVFNPNDANPGEESFTTVNEVSGEFNRVDKYNKEYEKEDGKYSLIQPFIRPQNKNN